MTNVFLSPASENQQKRAKKVEIAGKKRKNTKTVCLASLTTRLRLPERGPATVILASCGFPARLLESGIWATAATAPQQQQHSSNTAATQRSSSSNNSNSCNSSTAAAAAAATTATAATAVQQKQQQQQHTHLQLQQQHSRNNSSTVERHSSNISSNNNSNSCNSNSCNRSRTAETAATVAHTSTAATAAQSQQQLSGKSVTSSSAAPAAAAAAASAAPAAAATTATAASAVKQKQQATTAQQLSVTAATSAAAKNSNSNYNSSGTAEAAATAAQQQQQHGCTTSAAQQQQQHQQQQLSSNISSAATAAQQQQQRSSSNTAATLLQHRTNAAASLQQFCCNTSTAQQQHLCTTEAIKQQQHQHSSNSSITAATAAYPNLGAVAGATTTMEEELAAFRKVPRLQRTPPSMDQAPLSAPPILQPGIFTFSGKEASEEDSTPKRTRSEQTTMEQANKTKKAEKMQQTSPEPIFRPTLCKKSDRSQQTSPAHPAKRNKEVPQKPGTSATKKTPRNNAANTQHLKPPQLASGQQLGGTPKPVGSARGSNPRSDPTKAVGERLPTRSSIKNRWKSYCSESLDTQVFASMLTDLAGEVNPESMTEKVMSKVQEACDASMRSRRPYNRHHEPVYWWTESIADARRVCIRARRRYQRSRGRPTFLEHQATFQSARRTLKKAIRDSKRKCFLDLCDAAEHDPWGRAYKIVAKKLNANGNSVPSDPLSMRRIVEHLFPTCSESGGLQNTPLSQSSSMPIEEVTPNEMLWAAATIGVNKAPGPD
ncbi:hypothetical protein ACLKA6_010351, partial [Drosophila palustris]